MTCTVALTVGGAATVITTQSGTPTVLTSSGAPVILQLQQSVFTIDAPAGPALVVEVIKQGPPGPPGPVDFVCPAKLDATLVYASGRLDRVVYEDGREKVLTYDGAGLLVSVTCENLAGETVTKTLAYTDGLLTAVSSVVTPP